MSKSIKFKNETFLDSTSISHNKKILNEILDEILNPKWTDLVLKNDWENYGSSFTIAQYTKIYNQVFLKGFLKNGTSGMEIAQLPSRFQTFKNACFFSNDI